MEIHTACDKLYNIKSLEDGTWLGTRKGGDLFMKQARSNCNAYEGGPALDAAMSRNPDFEAIQVEEV